MLLESLTTLNQRLEDMYGLLEGIPKFRIVWSENQYEKRRTKYLHGVPLLEEVVVELPKYKQWIHNKYILERAVPVPWMQSNELTTKLSYEPLWVFQDKDGNALPPKWEACQLVIRTVNEQLANIGKGPRYADPESNKDPVEVKKERINNLMEDLFGNETSVGDALAHQTGVTVPSNYGDNNGHS